MEKVATRREVAKSIRREVATSLLYNGPLAPRREKNSKLPWF
jgi:hypothetical protein